MRTLLFLLAILSTDVLRAATAVTSEVPNACASHAQNLAGLARDSRGIPEPAAERPVEPRTSLALTLDRIRLLASAVETYADKENRYPCPDELYRPAFKEYAKDLKGRDGWGTPLRYAVSNDGLQYQISSPGEDQRFEKPLAFDADLKVSRGGNASLEADIVYMMGSFIQFPGVATESRSK